MTQFLTRNLDTGLLTEILGLSNSDAFGRQRVSSPHTVFDLTHTFGKQDIYVEELLTSGATTTHLPNESSVRLSVTTTVGSRAVRQTKRYFRYQPGKSMLVLLSGVLCTSSNSGVRSRVGLFDDDNDKTVDSGGNGIFFEYSGNELKIVKRSFTTGTQVDTVVTRASWSEGDPLDGTGASQINIDTTKIELFWMDLEWLGAGTVRCGIFYEGRPIHLHSFHAANLLPSVYMTRAILPIRYEIQQITGSAAASMKQICATVISEGGHDISGRVFSRPMTATRTVTAASFLPLFSIRLRSAYNRAKLIPTLVDLLTTSAQNLIYQVVVGGTLTGGTWLTHDATNSAVEYNISATAISGGRIVNSGYVGSVNRQSQVSVNTFDVPNVSIAGICESVTLAVIATGNANTYGAMEWREEL